MKRSIAYTLLLVMISFTPLFAGQAGSFVKKDSTHIASLENTTLNPPKKELSEAGKAQRMGLISLAMVGILVIPYLNLVAMFTLPIGIALAVVAIRKGIRALRKAKKKGDLAEMRKAQGAIIFGSISIGFVLLLSVALGIVLATWA